MPVAGNAVQHLVTEGTEGRESELQAKIMVTKKKKRYILTRSAVIVSQFFCFWASCYKHLFPESSFPKSAAAVFK